MALDDDLLELMVCPDSREKLALADDALVAKANARVEAGTLKNKNGDVVEQKLDGGLLRADGKVLYAVVEDIPNLMVDEGIPLDQFEDEEEEKTSD